jgi:hypothetical protein
MRKWKKHDCWLTISTVALVRPVRAVAVPVAEPGPANALSGVIGAEEVLPGAALLRQLGSLLGKKGQHFISRKEKGRGADII